MTAPLGIADLQPDGIRLKYDTSGKKLDYWYWCRRHEQAEHVTQPDSGIYRGADWKCIRIGPFMSEREANRLGERHRFGNQVDPALGMEIESTTGSSSTTTQHTTTTHT